jgi:hypothetical protein
MFKPPLALMALVLAPMASHAASNCDTIQAEIADKFRAGGITAFKLSTVDMEASVPGRVVGRCEQGTKKIVFVQEGPAQAPAEPRSAAPRRQEVITECRDGTVVAGGDCPR